MHEAAGTAAAFVTVGGRRALPANPSVSEVTVFTFRMYVVPIRTRRVASALAPATESVQIAIEDRKFRQHDREADVASLSQ